MAKPSDYPKSRFVGSNFVGPSGPENAKIMIIGEAPGKDENNAGVPFVGLAGKVLRKLCAGVGIDVEADCYLTNVLKYQPINNDITTSAAQLSIKENIQYLLKEIQRVRPHVIVPVGNTALHALGFNYRISRARGSIFPSQYGKIIPTFHPATIFHERKENDRLFTMKKDWQKIARHMTGTSVPDYNESLFELEPTIEDVELFMLHVKTLAQRGALKRVYVDLETYIGDIVDIPIKTVGIAINERKVMVVPFITENHTYYWKNETDAIRAVEAIGSILEDDSIQKVYHNALFDVPVLLNHGFHHSPNIYCTMIARYLIYHAAPNSLEYLVSIYTDYPPWKLEKGHGDLAERQYNARDCVVLALAKPGLDEDIRDNNLVVLKNIVMAAIKPVAMMMTDGISIDIQKYNLVKAELEAQLKEIQQSVADEAGLSAINLDSPDQVADLLFKKLKLRSQVKTKSGKKSTSEDVLNRLSLRYPDNTIVDKILEYRKLGTRYKTFIKNLPIKSDRKVHPSFSMTTAVTGRLAASNPPIHSLPRRKDPDGYIRSMYVAGVGKKMIGADYSQIELYVYAVLAGDKIWLDAYENGKDTHRINMISMIGEYEEKYRTFIKNFIYGFIYGSEGGEIEKVAPKELIQKISITQMLTNLKLDHPWLFLYRDDIIEQLKQKKYVTNAFGRRRYYPQAKSRDGELYLPQADIRSAFNFPIQSTVGDIMAQKVAMIREEFPWPRVQLPLQWHDAFYIIEDEDQAESSAKRLKEIMEDPIESPRGHTFKPRVDVHIGDSLSM